MTEQEAAYPWPQPGPATPEPAVSSQFAVRAAANTAVTNSARQLETLRLLGLPDETDAGLLAQLLRRLRTLPEPSRPQAIADSGLLHGLGTRKVAENSLQAIVLGLVTAHAVQTVIQALGPADGA